MIQRLFNFLQFLHPYAPIPLYQFLEHPSTEFTYKCPVHFHHEAGHVALLEPQILTVLFLNYFTLTNHFLFH